jgi:hypothetical protein
VGCLGVSLMLNNFLIQVIKVFKLTDSTETGMNEWFAPQISEHWP